MDGDRMPVSVPEIPPYKEHELEVYGGEGGKDCGKTRVLAHWAMIISRKLSNNKYLVMRDLLCTFAHFIIHHNKILLLK